MNLLAMAGNDPRVPPPPDPILVSWHRSLARLRTTMLQSEIGFIHAATRAGWSDDALRRALAIPASSSITEHREQLEAQRDYHHPSQHAGPWTG